MRKCIAYFLSFGCVIWVIFVIHINIDTIIGAYGSGPPYYGRTTNMDKWESPLAALAILDILSITMICIIGRWVCIQTRRR